jgi:hypothetical protein
MTEPGGVQAPEEALTLVGLLAFYRSLMNFHGNTLPSKEEI